MSIFKPPVSTPLFTNITKQITITFHEFDIKRCDERTFYITISLQYQQHKEICDLIFLVDKDELYGAISLNNRYENAQRFFQQHFNYSMLYLDELHIASSASTCTQFKKSFSQYAGKYPKYAMAK
ncbi:MAG: hypothetical protein ABS949_12785 [Solibacillus sp.]